MAKKTNEQESCICEQSLAPAECKELTFTFPDDSMQLSCCMIVKNKIKLLASFRILLVCILDSPLYKVTNWLLLALVRQVLDALVYLASLVEPDAAAPIDLPVALFAKSMFFSA